VGKKFVSLPKGGKDDVPEGGREERGRGPKSAARSPALQGGERVCRAGEEEVTDPITKERRMRSFKDREGRPLRDVSKKEGGCRNSKGIEREGNRASNSRRKGGENVPSRGGPISV